MGDNIVRSIISLAVDKRPEDDSASMSALELRLDGNVLGLGKIRRPLTLGRSLSAIRTAAAAKSCHWTV